MVRLDFNPSASDAVGQAKLIGANGIDGLEAIRNKPLVSTEDNALYQRAISIAQTKLEEATEKVVKALTFKFVDPI